MGSRVLQRLSVRICIGMTMRLTVVLFIAGPSGAQAQGGDDQNDGAAVMEAFNQQTLVEAEAFELTEEEKHKVLFYMGAVLLVLLCATAYLGISMGVWGKDVFVAHMVCAGLTVTLGIAHAVAAVVWFFPF